MYARQTFIYLVSGPKFYHKSAFDYSGDDNLSDKLIGFVIPSQTDILFGTWPLIAKLTNGGAAVCSRPFHCLHYPLIRRVQLLYFGVYVSPLAAYHRED